MTAFEFLFKLLSSSMFISNSDSLTYFKAIANPVALSVLTVTFPECLIGVISFIRVSSRVSLVSSDIKSAR